MSSRGGPGAYPKKSGNGGLALVLGGIVVMGFSYPFWLLMCKSGGNSSGARIDPTKDRLPGQTKIRGAFLNSGSKDMGPDPNVGRYLSEGTEGSE